MAKWNSMTHKPKMTSGGDSNNAVAGRLDGGRGPVGLLVEASRPVEIDRLGRNGQHGNARKGSENRHEKEDGTLREGIADCTRHDGDGDVAGVVEGRVPPDASSELFARVEAQGQSRDCRAEDVADNRHQAVGDQHRPEVGPRKDYRSPEA